MKKLFILLCTSLLAFCLVPFSGHAASIQNKKVSTKKFGVIKATSLNVRIQPNMNSRVAGTIKKGYKAEIIKKSGDWYKIKYGNIKGYVMSTYLTVSTVPTQINKPDSIRLSQKWGTIKVAPLNIRTAPNTTSTILGTLNQGYRVELLSKSGNWYKIKYSKVTGYVNADYLDISSGQAASSLINRNKTYCIVIDAGHGGIDQGASGTNGTKEKDLTLAIATKLKAKLQNNNHFKVLMTRTRSLDEKLTRAKKIQGLSEKVSIANNANADLFLSVHANTGLPDSYGTESFYTTPQSEELAQMIHKHLVKATNFGDRELKKRSLNVTRNTKMPSVLVEVGFLTNQVENHKMFDPSFQEGVARELAAGITEYYDRAGDQGNNTDVSRRN